MLYAGLALVGLVLLAGGGYYARKQYYAAKPAPIWVPLPLRADISMAEQEKLAKDIEDRLRMDGIMRQIAIDVDLQEKYNQPDLDAAVKELDRRIFVKVGTADSPNGSVPSINIGVTGNGHEKAVSGETVTRMMRDVLRMMGIDPETGKALNQPGAALEAPATDF